MNVTSPLAAPYSKSLLARLGRARAQPGSELLFRALGKPRPGARVLEPFGGWRVEALLMSMWGLNVESYEWDPEVDAAFTSSRVALEAALGPLERLRTFGGDGLEALAARAFGQTDIIYLDPMFPGSTKAALPKKAMQVLRGREIPEADVPRALDLALARAARVVLKRPSKGDAVVAAHPRYRSRFEAGSMSYLVFT